MRVSTTLVLLVVCVCAQGVNAISVPTNTTTASHSSTASDSTSSSPHTSTATRNNSTSTSPPRTSTVSGSAASGGAATVVHGTSSHFTGTIPTGTTSLAASTTRTSTGLAHSTSVAAIRATNHPPNTSLIIIGTIVPLALILGALSMFFFQRWRKKKSRRLVDLTDGEKSFVDGDEGDGVLVDMDEVPRPPPTVDPFISPSEDEDQNPFADPEDQITSPTTPQKSLNRSSRRTSHLSSLRIPNPNPHPAPSPEKLVVQIPFTTHFTTPTRTTRTSSLTNSPFETSATTPSSASGYSQASPVLASPDHDSVSPTTAVRLVRHMDGGSVFELPPAYEDRRRSDAN